MSRAETLVRITGELRVMGRGFLLGPVLTAMAALAIAAGFALQPGMRSVAVFVAWLSVQMLIPLLTGMFAAELIPHEAAHEIQLTLPGHYRRTALLRFALLSGWSTLVSVTAYCVLINIHCWPVTTPYPAGGPQALLGGLITCFMALGWCSCLGWCGSMVLHSASASRAVLVLAWLASTVTLAGTSTPGHWQLLLLGYLISGSLTLIVGCLVLGAPDRLFRKMEGHT